MTPPSAHTAALGDLSIIQRLLALLNSIRNLAEPLGSAAGLQQALASLVQLATLLGVNPAWIAQIQAILADPNVFNVVLAIVERLLGGDGSASSGGAGSTTSAPAVVVDEQTLSQWLPLISEIISLIEQIRGAR